jgi:hypothetical protein
MPSLLGSRSDRTLRKDLWLFADVFSPPSLLIIADLGADQIPGAVIDRKKEGGDPCSKDEPEQTTWDDKPKKLPVTDKIIREDSVCCNMIESGNTGSYISSAVPRQWVQVYELSESGSECDESLKPSQLEIQSLTAALQEARNGLLDAGEP